MKTFLMPQKKKKKRKKQLGEGYLIRYFKFKETVSNANLVSGNKFIETGSGIILIK